MAGRLPADRFVAVVAGRFYGSAGPAEREALRPVLELAERAAPGVVSLERRDDGAGFEVRVIERLFPASYETALRGAAATALQTGWTELAPAAHSTAGSAAAATGAKDPGWLARLVGAVRRLFSASS